MTRDGGMEIDVAIKVLRPDLEPASQGVQRLRDEGRLLGRLTHPTILRVYDLVVINGRAALVSEYVAGADLGQLLRTERLPPRGVFEVIAQVAAALEAAYSGPTVTDGNPLRLVHRDIKPDNIRIDPHGVVKLLDFGIAQAQTVAREAQTSVNTIMGSTQYLAPERLVQQEVGPESDVFALGCTLFESLAREALFARRSMRQMYLLMIDEGKFDRFIAERANAHRDRLGGERAVALIRAMTAWKKQSRPSAAEVASRCDAISDNLDGPTLTQWCRSRSWPSAPTVDGPLDGFRFTTTHNDLSALSPESSGASGARPRRVLLAPPVDRSALEGASTGDRPSPDAGPRDPVLGERTTRTLTVEREAQSMFAAVAPWSPAEVVAVLATPDQALRVPQLLRQLPPEPTANDAEDAEDADDTQALVRTPAPEPGPEPTLASTLASTPDLAPTIAAALTSATAAAGAAAGAAAASTADAPGDSSDPLSADPSDDSAARSPAARDSGGSRADLGAGPGVGADPSAKPSPAPGGSGPSGSDQDRRELLSERIGAELDRSESSAQGESSPDQIGRSSDQIGPSAAQNDSSPDQIGSSPDDRAPASGESAPASDRIRSDQDRGDPDPNQPRPDREQSAPTLGPALNAPVLAENAPDPDRNGSDPTPGPSSPAPAESDAIGTTDPTDPLDALDTELDQNGSDPVPSSDPASPDPSAPASPSPAPEPSTVSASAEPGPAAPASSGTADPAASAPSASGSGDTAQARSSDPVGGGSDPAPAAGAAKNAFPEGPPRDPAASSHDEIPDDLPKSGDPATEPLEPTEHIGHIPPPVEPTFELPDIKVNPLEEYAGKSSWSAAAPAAGSDPAPSDGEAPDVDEVPTQVTDMSVLSQSGMRPDVPDVPDEAETEPVPIEEAPTQREVRPGAAPSSPSPGSSPSPDTPASDASPASEAPPASDAPPPSDASSSAPAASADEADEAPDAPASGAIPPADPAADAAAPKDRTPTPSPTSTPTPTPPRSPLVGIFAKVPPTRLYAAASGIMGLAVSVFVLAIALVAALLFS